MPEMVGVFHIFAATTQPGCDLPPEHRELPALGALLVTQDPSTRHRD
jgi:hypothetical protein